jgi:hypothetical protein
MKGRGRRLDYLTANNLLNTSACSEFMKTTSSTIESCDVSVETPLSFAL